MYKFTRGGHIKKWVPRGALRGEGGGLVLRTPDLHV